MYELEQKEKSKIDFSQPVDAQKTPEDFFEQDPDINEQYHKLKSTFKSLWAEPDGLKDENGYVIKDKDYPGRTKNKPIRDESYGALIGAVTAGQPLDKKDFFLIGKAKNWMPALATGDLWVNINFDNIGFFWVKITIED